MLMVVYALVSLNIFLVVAMLSVSLNHDDLAYFFNLSSLDPLTLQLLWVIGGNCSCCVCHSWRFKMDDIYFPPHAQIGRSAWYRRVCLAEM
jgi:hypothetical protein